MSLVSRAIEKGETTGLMKLVADARTREILGAAIFGVGGDEAIHAVLNLMSAGETVDALRWAVPVHPTIAELLPTLAVELAAPGAHRTEPSRNPRSWARDSVQHLLVFQAHQTANAARGVTWPSHRP